MPHDFEKCVNDFEKCVNKGGTVRTIKPNAHAYLHICRTTKGKWTRSKVKYIKSKKSKKSKKSRKSATISFVRTRQAPDGLARHCKGKHKKGKDKNCWKSCERSTGWYWRKCKKH